VVLQQRRDAALLITFEIVPAGGLVKKKNLRHQSRRPSLRQGQDRLAAIRLPFVMQTAMEMFQFSDLLLGQLIIFHVKHYRTLCLFE